MAEEENSQANEEQQEPEEPTGAEEPTEAEEPAAEEPAAEETPAEPEETPAEPEETPAETEETPAEPEPAAAEPAEAKAETGEGEEAAKASSDLPPGADLDPIDLEPEARLSAEEKARLEAEEEERASREAQLTSESPEEPAPAARTPADMAKDARYIATGKRKRSIARIVLTPGDGKVEINRRALEEYFPRPLHQTMAMQPISAAGYEGTVDVKVRVHGGGVSGQASAVRHGIARALTEVDPDLRGDLKRRGYLTRDARVKERRKAGLKKARKRPQFSKR